MEWTHELEPSQQAPDCPPGAERNRAHDGVFLQEYADWRDGRFSSDVRREIEEVLRSTLKYQAEERWPMTTLMQCE
jgi:hypothetical protein